MIFSLKMDHMENQLLQNRIERKNGSFTQCNKNQQQHNDWRKKRTLENKRTDSFLST